MRLVPWLWSAALAAVILGPALGPGYVLSYDMVWVPDLGLGRDALGVGSALPRTVPSDAFVAVLDEVVPGMVLQKLVLLAALVVAGAGAARLVGSRSLAVQVVAATCMVWNPFVAERLVIGHWPVLLGYAVVPWLLLLAGRWDVGSRMPVALPLLLVVGSLSASTGLATAVALVAAGARRDVRRWLLLGALLLAANAPWLVAGLAHAAAATSSAAAAEVYATSGEGWLPGPLAALGLGGIWNAQVVPGTRAGFLAVVALVVWVVAAVIGLRRGSAGIAPAAWRAAVTCWVLGYGVAVLGWAVPGVMGWLAASVPGGGVLRDSSRLLALTAPLVVVLVARGAGVVLDLVRDRGSRRVTAAVLVAVPILCLPDAGWGIRGQLRPIDYPQDLLDVRAASRAVPPGDLAVLPFSSYRVPRWNHGHPVVNPLPRLVDRDAVVNDELLIDGRTHPGEDPRARAVGEALALPTARARTEALLRIGVSGVVIEQFEGWDEPAFVGDALLANDLVTVIALEGRAGGQGHDARVEGAMPAAWVAWLVLIAGGATQNVIHVIRRMILRRRATAG
ncbi:MAG: hypothetical protein LT071_09000 [Nocardioides sp.]|nr:hypothetical protein [Nocardioides sp.]